MLNVGDSEQILLDTVPFADQRKEAKKNNRNIIQGPTQVCRFRDHSQKPKPRIWQAAKKKAGSQTGPNDLNYLTSNRE